MHLSAEDFDALIDSAVARSGVSYADLKRRAYAGEFDTPEAEASEACQVWRAIATYTLARLMAASLGTRIHVYPMPDLDNIGGRP